MLNPMLFCDGYKLDHRRAYPDKTTKVYSNWTPRGSRVPGQNEETFFGLQYFLQKYLIEEFNNGFFNKPESEVCERYTRRINGYLGPNSIGEDHIRALWRIGFLPLEFKALPEGTKVPMRVPTMTVENTKPEFFWLTNYVETLMSCEMWLPCTSATTARYFRDEFIKGALATGGPLEFVDWQGHDFSMRGMEGIEAAALSGAGHLLYFTGTDTLPALDLVEEYYGPLPKGYMLGGSVAATEHSIACAWSGDCSGKIVDEIGYFGHLLDLYPQGIVSAVSDTYNLWNVLTDTLPKLKERIMSRDGKLVIRPDSGDPADIVCGNPTAPEGSPERKGVIQLLWDVFGGTTTSTEHRQLDSHIGCIYGDAITKERAIDIMQRLAANNFASSNMVFGIGSYTYQMVTRDTFGHAMKATHCEIAGKNIAIFKTPITDNGLKNSAKGRLSVIKQNGGLTLIQQATPEQEAQSLLTPVWRNGKFIRRETFDIIRNRARS